MKTSVLLGIGVNVVMHPESHGATHGGTPDNTASQQNDNDKLSRRLRNLDYAIWERHGAMSQQFCPRHAQSTAFQQRSSILGVPQTSPPGNSPFTKEALSKNVAQPLKRAHGLPSSRICRGTEAFLCLAYSVLGRVSRNAQAFASHALRQSTTGRTTEEMASATGVMTLDVVGDWRAFVCFLPASCAREHTTSQSSTAIRPCCSNSSPGRCI